MKLGPIQKAWVEGLRANAHLQCDSILGTVDEEGNILSACCLGFLHYTNTKESESLYIRDELKTSSLGYSYEKYGLLDGIGSLKKPDIIGTHARTSLAIANDRGASWTEIADYIENNPDNVFTKSV